ncbi:MAG TPA: glycosyltransferase family 2 protein [Candidatus Limnocylindria bacterium]|nr:glycosyltransferase family 2 protein [Candidatus Limnocylindria bacterium]
MTGDERCDVSAIVVSWNTADLLDECLRSLADGTPPGVSSEVIVVDNGSADGSAELVRLRWPAAVLIANAENRGFTKANNQAIGVARGEFLLLINADAALAPGALERMVDAMRRDRSLGAVGPRLVYGDGSWQRWTAGRAPGLLSLASYFLFLERAARGRGIFAGLYLGRDVRERMDVDWVSSACMLVRRAAIDAVGPLDERLFVYMDDVDLCQRLRDGGWRVQYVPDAQAIHHMGQSTKRRTGAASPEALRSLNRYVRRRSGRSVALAVRAIEAAGFAMRTAACLAVWLATGRAAFRSKARAHWRYLVVSLEGSGT